MHPAGLDTKARNTPKVLVLILIKMYGKRLAHFFYAFS